ncbi:type III secretion system inner membrane ring lipoprotein SctJ [Aquibium microcysteis]|uniref:type III secretion system inner membrane ring lipoprotein SctJ n=1 Tax=Aquibium microcysteis TaxID=675281 RepID=UPI001AEF2895|nr:type III secretion inner membrane ring lipoprotein SctJ [Aquibium microcysteis]
MLSQTNANVPGRAQPLVLSQRRRLPQGFRLAAAGLLFLLAGCQADLYSNLTETEANEMLGVLLANDVSADKKALGEGVFTLVVGKDDILRSLEILKNSGLPRVQGASMGQVFAKSGIVSSPFEERIRYVYALGEDVAKTIQQIDGVLTARVHIVLPEKAEFGQDVKPSSAAVFIKQRPQVDLDFLVPQIRRLVSNSIEGVSFDNVAVVLVEAQDVPLMPGTRNAPEMRDVLPGVRVAAASMDMLWMWVGGFAAVLLLSIVGNVALMVARMRSGKPASTREADA